MSEELRYIDLRMRLPNDGSLLFQVLSSLTTTVARNARASHLMMLGTMLESGRLSPQSGGATINAMVREPSANQPATPGQITSLEHITEASSRTAPNAEDVMTVFGG
ncbi:MAG TPA: hypothetical protein VLA64_05900 [Azonexus sp.]|nr:hypothetical protein [Azonexus sp.]